MILKDGVSMEEKRTGTNEEKVHEINGYKVRRRYGNEEADNCLRRIVQIKISQILQDEKKIVT